MATEEALRAVTIGEPRRVDGRIELVAHDPRWARQYEQLAGRVRAALGERVRLLEHVGSTSVPGLSAKPIIDMVLEVADSSDEVAWVPDLERAGFRVRIREPDWFEHRVMWVVDEHGQRSVDVNLHVFSAGCPETVRMVGFRDHLRSHAGDRDLYEATKHRLAAQRWTFVQDYADAKSEVVTQILARAGMDGDR